MGIVELIKCLCPEARLHSVLWQGYKSRLFSSKRTACVYLMNIGNDVYVGSSCSLNLRVNSHFYALKSGKHNSKKVQNAYDRIGLASIWVLEELANNEKLTRLEQDYINKFNPSLNIAPAAHVGLRTDAEKEIFAQYYNERRSKTTLVCPNCGVPLELKIKEKE